jgi:site-specific DNA-methyltransferase (adenine-specific)
MSKLKIVYKHVDEIIPYVNNPRKISQNAIDKVASSIKNFGFKVPIIIDKDNEIVAGHNRILAAKKLGMEEVPCIVVEDLTEPQIKAFRIADNKTSEFAEWDMELLEIELEGLDDEFTGFDIDELGELFNDDTEVIEDDFDEEPPEEPISKRGDIWLLGKHRLMCGDSTGKDVDTLMDGNKADMVFTDPPYGMNLDTDYSKMEGNGRKGKTYSKVIGDNEDFKDDLIETIFNNFNYCKEIFLWGVDYYFDLIPNFKNGNLIVWDKTLQTNGDADYNSEFELLWTKNRHKKEVIHFNWFRYFGLSQQDIKTREHPTQKPLQVITPFIEKYSNENDIIVDIYGGSGSTLIACEQLDRICYMMELDEKYVDVIVNRYIAFKESDEDVILIRDGVQIHYKEVEKNE